LKARLIFVKFDVETTEVDFKEKVEIKEEQ
jgi:hypothetical protein